LPLTFSLRTKPLTYLLHQPSSNREVVALLHKCTLPRAAVENVVAVPHNVGKRIKIGLGHDLHVTSNTFANPAVQSFVILRDVVARLGQFAIKNFIKQRALLWLWIGLLFLGIHKRRSLVKYVSLDCWLIQGNKPTNLLFPFPLSTFGFFPSYLKQILVQVALQIPTLFSRMTTSSSKNMAGASAPYTPKADLETVTLSKVLDRDSETMKTTISACENVGFFYLDISDQYSATMLNNLDKLNLVMEG
ncbi:2og-fe oxygenase family protein, partial [Colletotrichum incanum]